MVAWLAEANEAAAAIQQAQRTGKCPRRSEPRTKRDARPFDVFLIPSAGTYNCRVINGTDRVSAHTYTIASIVR